MEIGCISNLTRNLKKKKLAFLTIFIITRHKEIYILSLIISGCVREYIEEEQTLFQKVHNCLQVWIDLLCLGY